MVGKLNKIYIIKNIKKMDNKVGNEYGKELNNELSRR